MKFLGARPQHEDLKLLVEDSDAVENNLAKFDSSGNPVDSGLSTPNVSDAVTKKHTQNTDQYLDFGGANQVAVGDVKDAVAKKHEHANKTELDTYSATTQNLEYWVDGTNGSDNNNGSSGSPFKTIAKAVSMIPQIVNHSVTINVADGSYSEGITLTGYMGSGVISVVGNTTTPANVVLSGRIIIQKVAHFVFIHGMKTTYTGNNSVEAGACSCIQFNYIVAEASDANYSGIFCAYSFAHVQNSTVSNKKYGITSRNSSVCSEANSGTGNTNGIAAMYGGTLGKRGSQPSGTTAEFIYAGGEIR